MSNLSCKYSHIIEKAAFQGCRIMEKELLKHFTTFKVGGECEALISINSTDTASKLFALCNQTNTPYLIIGKGSNLLVDDTGFDGIVLLIGKDFSNIRLIDDNTIECEAGVPLAKAAHFAYKNGLTGLEFAWGIPGTVGGAVFMNAGAYGGEISDVILNAEYIDENGNICCFSKDELQLGYRHSIFQDGNYLISKAIFKLKKGNSIEIKTKMDELLARRKDKQPLEYASGGSTFKRPDGNFASFLIQECGLKGCCCGDAQVSEKHSGFVINKKNATFSDIISLINLVKEKVFQDTGYKLECEIKIISEKEFE